MKNNKEKLLDRVRAHVDYVRQAIEKKLQIVTTVAEQSLKEIAKMPPENQAVQINLRENAAGRAEELAHLHDSPYFIKCDITDEVGKQKEYFFAKYEFSEESIYSWVAPVSTIRFENPGIASYRLPNGKTKAITIRQKETYTIVDGKIILFSLEKAGSPRELIYQEHFTKQKTGFILPEIVAQMEKAQDEVIRANHKGPLVISGPAGSGKTTLALHRVAYLSQVPDTAALYPPDSVIVFVQDTGTQNYFSALLPSLGIHNVKIETFSEWACKVLGLQGYPYIDRYGGDEAEKDAYEYHKRTALEKEATPRWNKDIYTVLTLIYSAYLSPESCKLFTDQKKEKKLDRFDITILLRSYFAKHKKFEIRREYQTFVKHTLTRKTEKIPVLYSLMIVDEFENYLPEQLQILKSCLNDKTRSIIYVGDMAQQVKLGTIRRFEDVGEIIPPERNIRLYKVYRNTKNILRFIKNLGYKIELPEGLPEGTAVVEKLMHTVKEEIEYIKTLVPAYTVGTVGILAKDEAYLTDFRREFASMKNVHVLSMLEAQGVEFDLVCIVGIEKESFGENNYKDISAEHAEERKRMQRDLLYVALTRAITELHILGTEKLSLR